MMHGEPRDLTEEIPMSGSDCHPDDEVLTVRRSPIRGYGVISTSPFEPGSTIGFFDGLEVPNVLVIH